MDSKPKKRKIRGTDLMLLIMTVILVFCALYGVYGIIEGKILIAQGQKELGNQLMEDGILFVFLSATGIIVVGILRAFSSSLN